MDAANLLHQIRIESFVHSKQYAFLIEAITIAVLCYIGITDFRKFKIPNASLIILLLLYFLYVPIARTLYEISASVFLAAVIFVILLGFYARKLVGGGDVKLLTVACLWVGTSWALPFSVALLLFISLHFAAVRTGWVNTINIEGSRAMPYAPAVATALIITILLGSPWSA